MNNDDVQILQSLVDANASIKELNALLNDLIKFRKKDELNWLKAVNAELKVFNTLLADLSESRKKDALMSKLHQAAQ